MANPSIASDSEALLRRQFFVSWEEKERSGSKHFSNSTGFLKYSFHPLRKRILSFGFRFELSSTALSIETEIPVFKSTRNALYCSSTIFSLL
mmetsp:Transcript_10647/g.17772  ORF Transcript_10647/g.17772 Transcript_10647/m.17772 type:complete len:92 (+) Transcript_10647:533-808(+)